MLLGQEVHYFMVYIAYFTELNLQISNYMQERRICCENCKYALDENFHGHFCPQRKAAKFCHPDINIIDFESVTQLQGKKILSIHLCDTKNEEKENHLERTLQEVSHSNHRSLKVEWHPVCGADAPFIVPPLWICSMTPVDLWDNPYVHSSLKTLNYCIGTLMMFADFHVKICPNYFSILIFQNYTSNYSFTFYKLFASSILPTLQGTFPTDSLRTECDSHLGKQ